jgi:voltage-gated potassium channel
MRGLRHLVRSKRIAREPSPYSRLALAISLIVVLLGVGTIGYMVVEGWGFLNALFMTVITFSTVGYGEVHRLDNNGKILSIVLILFGGGMAAWALLSCFEVVISDQSRRFLQTRRIRRRVKGMRDHFIVCGYGRIGRAIVAGYIHSRVPFVVIEIPGPLIDELRVEGIPHIEGDGSNDSVLEEAGIARARGLIAVTSTDAVNTFITLSARGLRRDLMIVARADAVENAEKLYRAGATKVVSPHVLGGWWMSMTAINPAAIDFIEGMSLADHTRSVLYELTVGQELHNQPFGAQRFRERTGALVVATRRGESFRANPSDDALIEANDGLIAIGSPDELARLAKLCNPKNPTPIDLPLLGG